ncbi:universal stress protein [Nitrospira moscoviensis]|uniref:Putative Universal stress protein UspA n=1 Tax=Nitrospira moscoviensis TaxID=42253 RepID=A0A0K2GH77_NITMO|nr:universal stress protein [Nitrospira moscoviensis]ALA60209.1 putative Universal stress protein UspA [Nitrospira moscoviensis]
MKVLAATDGSKHGRWAIEWLAQLPFLVQPTVRVLHVVDVAGLRAPFMVQPVIVGTERYLQAEVKRMETAAKATKKQSEDVLAALGLGGTVTVERGAVAATIVRHARRGVGLLAIGSRGLDALDRFMLGSTSNHAIHHAPCSVLVVKEAPKPVRQIVLAIDGSPASDKAVRFLVRTINPTPGGPDREPLMVTVVHVLPYLKYPELREAGRAVAQRVVDKVAKAGFQVVEAVRLGKPADEILTVAKQHKADLIVTGAKGLGAIGRVLLGSVSTRVVQHADCSVLVVR